MKLRILPHHSVLMMFFIGLTFVDPGYTQGVNRLDSNTMSCVPHIKWIRQWPSSDKKKKQHSFRSRFNSIFLGKKTPSLTRPVAVMGVNPENFWVLDQGAMSIFNIQGELGDIPHFLQKLNHDFISLVGICSDSSGGFFFTDSFEKKIYRFLPDKKKLQVLNDSLILDQPTGIAWSEKTREIWVTETNAHRIAIVNEKGERIRNIGSRGTAPGEFNYPTHIWIDKNGLVYINDAMNFRIQVLNPAGDVVSVFGKPGDASGFFARPKGVAVDSHGNIYSVDALFHTVQVFDLKGLYLNSIGGQGQGEGEFWMPSGIYIDRNDFVYVADSYNSRIQVFQLNYNNTK
ncbi:MAG: 6-bladed beta-propeller [bacterium]